MKTQKDKIDELITLERKNNLFNHIHTSLFNKGETIAEKNLNEYIIWTRHYWVGTFYPIFRIKFNKNNEIESIQTKLSLNGKLWVIIIGSLIFSFFLFVIIIPIIQDIEYFEYSSLFILGIYGLLAFGIYRILRKVYKTETKYLTNELKIAVGLESKENIERIENEKIVWSLKMIITRIILYPLSIFILLFTINSIIKGSFLRGKAILGILIPIAYLYSDIKILRKKRNNESQQWL